MDRIQAFYITPSAREQLGDDCLQGAFNWQRDAPVLQRLTIGEPDPDELAAWRKACRTARAKPFLVLGPADRTPDFEAHPMLEGIDLLSAHAAETPDVAGLRGILHEPDEVFTTAWETFASGSRGWFVPPGPVAEDGDAFWQVYSRAWSDYAGPVFDLNKREFEEATSEVWSAPLSRQDLHEPMPLEGGGARFRLQRFPFCALRFDASSRMWSTEGWLPRDIDRVDPSGDLRRSCEREIGRARAADMHATTAVDPMAERSAGQPASEMLAAMLSSIANGAREVLLLVDRTLMDLGRTVFSEPALRAIRHGAPAATRSQHNQGQAEVKRPESIWETIQWDPGRATLHITWAGTYAAYRRLDPDGVLACIQADGRTDSVVARFRQFDDGRVDVGTVLVDLPSSMVATSQEWRLEIRVAAGQADGSDRLILIFKGRSAP